LPGKKALVKTATALVKKAGCREHIPGGYHGGYMYNLAGTGIQALF